MRVPDFIYLALFAIVSFAEEDSPPVIGKRWAVLVASSTGWSNYRHQADICHAYQIVKANGIPTENIITMMVDDIAYNTRNPTKGKIINRPKGDDVYKGIVIDYKGTDVNTNNFLNIITGNKSAMQSIGTGKVVEGGPNDRIFINFVDHGSNGLLAFPDDYLYADQLNAALNSMYENSAYSKILLYIEACKSGSMFDGIIGDSKNDLRLSATKYSTVLAITAAAPRENSYGCYCGSQSGPYKTCLGDLFSVLWMENIDATILELSAINRTVFTDFNEVRTSTTKSNVMIYGDFDVGHEKLSSFVGIPINKAGQSSTKPMSKTLSEKITVSSQNVHEHTIHQLLTDDKLTADEKHHLAKEMRQNNEMRIVIDSVLQDIYFKIVKERPDIKMGVGEFNAPQDLNLSLDMFPCYRRILKKITKSCFSLPRNSYALQRLQIFANLCIVDKYIYGMVRNVIVGSCSKITKIIENVY